MASNSSWLMLAGRLSRTLLKPASYGVNAIRGASASRRTASRPSDRTTMSPDGEGIIRHPIDAALTSMARPRSSIATEFLAPAIVQRPPACVTPRARTGRPLAGGCVAAA